MSGTGPNPQTNSTDPRTIASDATPSDATPSPAPPTSSEPRLHPIERMCLFLDIDGTLLDFVDSPRLVAVDAELVELLDRAAGAAFGALALVSGRSLAQIDELFAPTRWPAAGSARPRASRRRWACPSCLHRCVAD